MEPTTECLFALRTNCGFYRTRGELALHGRVKEAAILYDSVLLQYGIYHAAVAPGGSFDTLDRDPRGLGTLRDLPLAKGNFALNVRPSDDDGPFRTILASAVERHLHAEFLSLRDEIAEALRSPRLPAWIRLVDFELTPERKSAVAQSTSRDGSDTRVWRRATSRFLKSRVLGNLNHDIAVAVDARTDLSVDQYFLPLLRRKARGEGDQRAESLRLLVPNVGQFSWDQITEIRDHPGIDSFRRQLAEIQEQARAAGISKERVFRRTIYDLAAGWRPPSHLETSGKIAIDLLLGLSPVGGLASAALDLREAEAQSTQPGEHVC